jgi:hypothetical protein
MNENTSTSTTTAAPKVFEIIDGNSRETMSDKIMRMLRDEVRQSPKL